MMYCLGDVCPTTSTQQPWDGWVADTATVIGQVVLGEKVSVWFGAVIRADNDLITIGDFSNIQENAVLHVDSGRPITIGQYVTVGHQAMLHGCTIGDNSLIGIGAVVLNGAVIGQNCIIGANALVPENKIIPDNSVVMGSPAQVVKEISPMAMQMIKLGALHYAQKIEQYKAELRPFVL